MGQLGGGCRVIGKNDGKLYQEGTRTRRRTIGSTINARDIEQSVSHFDQGLSPGQVNPTSEEVHFTVAGSGACYINGHRYELEAGAAAYVPPEAECCFDAPFGDLEIVSVCCPQIANSVFDLPPRTKPIDIHSAIPTRCLHERERESLMTGIRSFKLLADKSVGCQRVTQFIGLIPTSEAPPHYHTYEEALYVVEGRGVMWADGKEDPVEPGTCIYLPRQVSHSLKTLEATPIRLLGVFHPSGSPAVRYGDE